MNLWNRLKKWYEDIKKRHHIFDEEMTKIVHGKSAVQEDPRAAAVRSSVRKSFEQQEQAMNIRALKPHDPGCKDPLTCTKKICFIKKHDKIVDKETVSEAARRKSYIRRTKMRRIEKDIKV